VGRLLVGGDLVYDEFEEDEADDNGEKGEREESEGYSAEDRGHGSSPVVRVNVYQRVGVSGLTCLDV
jgi:hypothetical protein